MFRNDCKSSRSIDLGRGGAVTLYFRELANLQIQNLHMVATCTYRGERLQIQVGCKELVTTTRSHKITNEITGTDVLAPLFPEFGHSREGSDCYQDLITGVIRVCSVDL